ncbi:transporter [Rhodobacteraceae bacterium CCMM004]|nr:transporter [Rhodobacteraceae bacterium CCMM004]
MQIARAVGTLVRRAALAAALTVAAGPALAQTTLADTLITAYRHSGLLEQNRATLRAADEDVAQAIAALRPVIRYSGRVTYANPLQSNDNLSASLGLTGDLLLYDGGSSRLAVDAAKEAVLATREALIGIEQDVLFNAVTAYLSVRRAQAFVELRQNNVRLITRELRAAEDRFEVGEITRTDVAIAQARLAGARSAVATAQGDLAEARAFYRAAVGVAPGSLAPPPPAPRTADSLDAAQTVARRTHPSIRQAMRQVTQAEINIARAEASMRPNLSARAGVSLDQDFNDSSSIGLELSGPIYQGGQLTSLYRQAQARRDAARAALHVVRHSVDQNVANAWAQLMVAGASLEASQQEIRAATTAFRGVQEEATLGARTTLDVLDAEQELLDARAAAISAEISRYQAVYALLSSMGLLTVEHLQLGIVTYDPAAYYNAVKDAPVRKVSPQGEKLDRILKGLARQ